MSAPQHGIAPIVDLAVVQPLQHIDGADVVIADVRWYLDGRSGSAAYETGHVPGAIFVDLDHDLSDHLQPTIAGRHPLPTPEQFSAAMARLGIGDETIVIAYDDAGGSTAGRLVFMLRVIGHQAALLDGGLQAWPTALETGPSPTASTAEVRGTVFTTVEWPKERFATADDLANASAGRVVLDARAADRFRGENEVVDPSGGHIPFARNAPWGANIVQPGGQFKPVDALREQFRALGVDSDTAVTCYCGSGVSACNDLLVLEHIGVTDTRLFVPSWSGWSADPARPIATGDA